MRVALVGGLLIGALACSPRTGVVARFDAPDAASGFSHAALTTYFSDEQGGGGHGFGPSSFEMSALELSLDERKVVLDSTFGFEPMFWEPKPARELIKGHYELRLAPDGRWLAVSKNGGDTWRLVDVESGLSCRHLEVAGPTPAWASLPSREQVAADILLAQAKKPGPLHLSHPWPGDAWSNHEPRSELELAISVARAHPEDPALVDAALDVLEVQSQPALLAVVAARANSDEAVRARLRGWIAAAPPERSGTVVAALHLLGDDTAANAAAIAWLAKTIADSTALARRLDAAAADWDLVELFWTFARDAYARGKVEPALAGAMRTFVKDTAARLKPPQKPLGNEEPNPWGFISSPTQAAMAYAVDVLALAKDTETLRALPCRQHAPGAVWPPTFTKGPVKDHRIHREGDSESLDYGDVNAWIRAALDH